MTDLRLVLLLAGALALALVWLLDLRRERKARRQRILVRPPQSGTDSMEPRLAEREQDNDDLADLPPMSPTPDMPQTKQEPAAPQFIAIHVKATHQHPFMSQSIFAAAESAGLSYAEPGIFHMPGTTRDGPPLFSLVNLLEPGTFDRNDPARGTRGLTLIMRLPAESNPAMVLDLMLQTADLLATSLGGGVYGQDHRSLDKERTAALRRQAAGSG